MIQLKKTKEWSGEHREDNVTGSIRIYVGQLYCGVAEPIKEEIDLYHFHSFYDFIEAGAPEGNGKTLEDIKMQVELSLKEFANKFCYTKQQTNESKD